jgi:TonB-dependent SusC/RagA subfamily outer membrane receptor
LNSGNCSGSAIDRIQILVEFDPLIKTNRWQDILFFGKDQRIVTPNTSYIVLERTEDYVRYQIEPPKELEDECAKMGFVKADKRKKFQQYNKLTEFQILNGVVQTYNARMKNWGDEGLISLSVPKADDKAIPEKSTKQETAATASIASEPLAKDFAANLDEVIVTGYSMKRKSNLTGSVSVIRANEIHQGYTSVEQILSGRVPGMVITPSNNFQPGSISSIRIRGMSSMTNNQPLFIIDGIPVSGDINNIVSPNDIESIEVLKDASATALYGSRGGNGVIYIKTKRGRNFTNYYSEKPYRLSEMEDEDYLVEIKEVERDEKWNKYKQLQVVHGSSAGFYLDIAQHLHESGYQKEAILVLSNAAEVSAGNLSVLKAMAFMLEQWGEYNEALDLYLQISKSNPNDIKAYRDIALVYYQKGAYQKAVDVLYEGITKNTEAFENTNTEVKALLLNDLNAIVAIHKDGLDLSAINAAILKPVPLDLRIVVDCNNSYSYNQLSIVEPGGAVAQQAGSKTKNGGYIAYGYNYGTREYGIKEAKTGKYKVRINYYDHYRRNTGFPVMIKLTTFKNFGMWDQSIHIENVIMNNQNGTVEVAEIKW